MSERKQAKKLSRRDAIKLLGAITGATVLANLPAKWKTPEVAKGVLPVHAQTSGPVLYSVTCNGNTSFQSSPFNGNVGVTITPNDAGVPMNLLLTGNYNPAEQNVVVNGLPSNPILTGPGGVISIPITITITPITANSGSIDFFWEFDDPAQIGQNCTQTISWAGLPMAPTVVTVLATHNVPAAQVTFDGNLTSEGTSPVTERGFVWSQSNPTPTTADTKINLGAGGVGTFQFMGPDVAYPHPSIYLRAYAINSVGTAYGDVIVASVCLAEGTLVLMADGTNKKIEDIDYTDWLRVWNFDEGHFDQAQPLWIKKMETTNRYNLLEFSDGSSLKTIFQHRIFNKELGAFTFPMTEDTPLGTTTFNAHGEEVTLINKQVIHEQVNYYNVITHFHMNLFANGILTSCMYNNVYPIVDMKFVKEERELIPQSEYDVEEKYYEGLRLGEQTIRISDTLAYINRLEVLKVEQEVQGLEAMRQPVV